MAHHQSLTQSMDELEQLKNLWPDSVDAFNKMVQEKIVEFGLDKHNLPSPHETPRQGRNNKVQRTVTYLSSKTISQAVKQQQQAVNRLRTQNRYTLK